MTLNSAEVIVMCAYGAHFIKEVATKTACCCCKNSPKQRRKRSLLQGADKNQFLKPLAIQFLKRGIVTYTRDDVNIESIRRQDVVKTGTF